MKCRLAVLALGLGIGISGSVADEAEEADETDRDVEAGSQHAGHEHPPDLVLVFADDYHPNARFRPIDRLPQQPVNAILGFEGTAGNPVVNEPTDYVGYVVRVETYPNEPGRYTFAFVNEQTLRQDRWYRLTEDVVFFDTHLSLLSVAITTDAGVGETTTREGTTTATERPTTPADETTTQAVVVKTSEATDDE